MKVFTALLVTETNTFSPFLTGFANFEQTCLVRGGAHGDQPFFFAVPLICWRDMAQARGWNVAESLAAAAKPAGITLRPVYESYRDEILADLRAAMPVDMVLLIMHGAMVADGYDDCEGDLVQRVRAIVGSRVPIGVELDLHCHLTQTLVEHATTVITFKEYPHTDIPERAEELFRIIADAAEGKVQPVMSMHDCGMIGTYRTTQEPVKSFVAQMQSLEGQGGVLSVSLGHGFSAGDVADLGTRVLVVTDHAPEQGAALAKKLGEQFFAMRDLVLATVETLDAVLDKALASPEGPTVLADVADNAGGGAPNDSTFILRRLLDRGIGDTAIGCIWDPVVVSIAHEVGEGVELDLRIGGKMGSMSGDPVDLRVRVGKIARNATQRFGEGTAKLGDAAALHAPNGLDIVVISQREQTFSPEVFTNVGIDPTCKRILVVKSTQHFYAAFAPIAKQVLYVVTPGAMLAGYAQRTYKKARRDLWPLG